MISSAILKNSKYALAINKTVKKMLTFKDKIKSLLKMIYGYGPGIQLLSLTAAN